jgi:low affinity Fe/Cu permease
MQSNGTRCTPSQSPLPRFDRAAKRCEQLMGNSLAFALAVLLLLAWLIAGPFFGFSDTWQLVINTATTIVTFLMVFLIQNTQNRMMAGLHLKLDELIRSNEGAYNALLKTEEMSLEEIEKIRTQYDRLAMAAREKLKIGQVDVGTPQVDIR